MSILDGDIDIKPVLVSDILTLHWWSAPYGTEEETDNILQELYNKVVPYGDYDDAIEVITSHLMNLYKEFYECNRVKVASYSGSTNMFELYQVSPAMYQQRDIVISHPHLPINEWVIMTLNCPHLTPPAH
jgi:hypothetical protein